MEKIAFKEATAADAEDYIKLEKIAGGKTYFALNSAKEFLEEIAENKIYLFTIAGKTIGHISVRTDSDGSVHIGGFAIEPEFQGKGYGRQAFGLIIEIFKDAPKMRLKTHPDNLKAIGIYRSFGFEIVDRKENYHGDGEPRLVMVKSSK